MKERQRQWHYNQSKRSELNETNLTNLTNLSEARSLKKYAECKTLRSASNKPQQSCSSAKGNHQQYLTQRSNKQRMLHRPDLENSLSYRILNEILNSPEVSANFENSQLMHYASLERRSQPQPFDCSELKGTMGVVDEQDETFSRVVDQGALMSRQDYRSWQVQRTYNIARLDEVQFSLEKLAETNDEYFGLWSKIHEANEQIRKVQKVRKYISSDIQKTNEKIGLLKDQLYGTAKEFVGGTLPKYQSDPKTRSVNRILEAHEQLSNRVGSKAFMQSLTFSIKVLLPTYISDPTLFVLYTKLLDAKLTRKLIMLVKKEAARLSPRDLKAVQQYIKVLSEEELNYSRRNSTQTNTLNFGGNNPKSAAFHLQVAELVEKTQHLVGQIRHLQNQQDNQREATQLLLRQIEVQRGLINEKVRQEASVLARAYQQATSTTTDFVRLVANRLQQNEQACMQLMHERSTLQRQLKRPSTHYGGRSQQ